MNYVIKTVDGSAFLMHHGVKGQKWGVRRYQNEDGSYKSGAKGRYDDGDGNKKTPKISDTLLKKYKVKQRISDKQQIKEAKKVQKLIDEGTHPKVKKMHSEVDSFMKTPDYNPKNWDFPKPFNEKQAKRDYADLRLVYEVDREDAIQLAYLNQYDD